MSSVAHESVENNAMLIAWKHVRDLNQLKNPGVACNEWPNPPWNTTTYEWDTVYPPCSPEWFAQRWAKNALLLHVKYSETNPYEKYMQAVPVRNQDEQGSPVRAGQPGQERPLEYGRIGVLTDTHLYRFKGTEPSRVRLKKPIESLGDILGLGLEYRLHAIWVLTGTALSDNASSRFIESPDTLDTWQLSNPVYSDVYEDEVPRCSFVKAWKKPERRAPGERGYAVHVGYAEHNERWKLDTIDNPLVLLGTLIYLEDALGYPVHYSPAHVGKKLMAQVNQGEREKWCTPVDLSSVPVISQTKVVDIAWKRELNQDELTMSNLLVYDKNSAYTASCTSVLLGEGTPEHMQSPSFDVKKPLPGLYRCTVSGSSIFDGVHLPSPIENLSGTGNQDGSWYWTYTVKLLLELGYSVTIHEGYVWTKYHTTLRPWGETLWHARCTLNDKHPECNRERYQNTSARGYAYKAIKPVMNSSLGTLDADEKKAFKYAGALDRRPDWYQLIKDNARYQLFWRMRVLLNLGYSIVGVHADCLFIPARTPEHSSIPVMLERENKLGGYKRKLHTDITIEQVRDLFNSRLSIGDINTKLNQLDKQSNQDNQ